MKEVKQEILGSVAHGFDANEKVGVQKRRVGKRVDN